MFKKNNPYAFFSKVSLFLFNFKGDPSQLGDPLN